MTGIIVLAAGESKRFGSPKQLAVLDGKPLLRRAVETALDAGLGPVTVVLGASDQPCRDLLAGLEVAMVHNPGWRSGMGGSIASGIKSFEGLELAGVIISLADQPGVTGEHLRSLERASAGKPFVASRYEGQLGAPAWFSKGKFDELSGLAGEMGAKLLIVREPAAHAVEMAAAASDVDTPEDLLKFSWKNRLIPRSME